MKWLRDHLALITTVSSLAIGCAAYAHSLDTRVSVVESDQEHAEQAIQRIDQNVREIHQHLLRAP